eukprot:g18587.t1
MCIPCPVLPLSRCGRRLVSVVLCVLTKSDKLTQKDIDRIKAGSPWFQPEGLQTKAIGKIWTTHAEAFEGPKGVEILHALRTGPSSDAPEQIIEWKKFLILARFDDAEFEDAAFCDEVGATCGKFFTTARVDRIPMPTRVGKKQKRHLRKALLLIRGLRMGPMLRSGEGYSLAKVQRSLELAIGGASLRSYYYTRRLYWAILQARMGLGIPQERLQKAGTPVAGYPTTPGRLFVQALGLPNNILKVSTFLYNYLPASARVGLSAEARQNFKVRVEAGVEAEKGKGEEGEAKGEKRKDGEGGKGAGKWVIQNKRITQLLGSACSTCGAHHMRNAAGLPAVVF